MIRIILQTVRGSFVFHNGCWTEELTGKEVIDPEMIAELNSEVNDELPQSNTPKQRSKRKPVVDKWDSL